MLSRVEVNIELLSCLALVAMVAACSDPFAAPTKDELRAEILAVAECIPVAGQCEAGRVLESVTLGVPFAAVGVTSFAKQRNWRLEFTECRRDHSCPSTRSEQLKPAARQPQSVQAVAIFDLPSWLILSAQFGDRVVEDTVRITEEDLEI